MIYEKTECWAHRYTFLLFKLNISVGKRPSHLMTMIVQMDFIGNNFGACSDAMRAIDHIILAGLHLCPPYLTPTSGMSTGISPLIY
jgi:hypothetical protein